MLNVLALIFRILPLSVSKAIGYGLGKLGYFILPKKTRTIYLNLKTGFAKTYTHQQLKALTQQVYGNVVMSFVEFLCLPKLKRIGFEHFVKLNGREHVEQARLSGKGVICLAVHSGNWELSNVIASLSGFNYSIVVNRQVKTPAIDRLLEQYRKIGGANIIIPGENTKDMIKSIKSNDIVTIVFDQGGIEGQCVPFLGKPASLSTGAIRLALRYGCAICPVWMNRSGDKHTVTVLPPLDFQTTGNEEKDVQQVLVQAWNVIEPLLIKNPSEYLWFYKVWKYSTRVDVLILHDGKTGHLRQSQGSVKALEEAAKLKKKTVMVQTLQVEYRSRFHQRALTVLSLLGIILPVLRGRWIYAFLVTPKTLEVLDQYKPDIVVSTGSTNGALLHSVADMHRAKSIAILKQGLMPLQIFDRVVLPVHDGHSGVSIERQVRTKVAVNLIDKKYLKNQTEALLQRYSHLKSDVRFKIGVMIGGDTKGVVMKAESIRQFISQLKNIAEHYNATLLLTTSRRTAPAIDQLIQREFADFKRLGLCIIANNQEVPEAVGGILGLSDMVIVSSESISMVSEAICAGKMTIVFAATGMYSKNPANKYDQFVMGLQQQGYVMAANIKDLSHHASMLMTRKIVLKTVDDQQELVKGFQGLV